MADRDRPSRHGAILGAALARIEAEGRRFGPDLPDCCATCAFRPGCMTNMMAATGLTALNVLLGIDGEAFACHHGMKDGQPTKLCAGYAAAKLAPFEFVMAEIAAMHDELGAPPSHDAIRAEFDAWIARVDPDGMLDDYARGRLFLRDRPFTVAHGNIDRSPTKGFAR
jgi:hypothetical protein